MPLVEGEYMKKYDIIFAGWGASTCVLLIEMANQNLLENKSIVIIDPGSKVENDKTFCFWAQPSDRLYLDYASIISHEWSSIKINNDAPQAIAPLIYCHINSSDLYKLCREVMDKYSIEHLQESIESISFDKSMEVATSESIFSCEWLFDARPPAQKRFNKRFSMYQSFLGFKVALKNQKFDSEVYHMMDFRVDQKESTQFVYLLPYDNQHALVELTRFGKKLIEKEEAKKILDEYIFENYGEYEVLDVEKGVIPMATISSKKNVINRYVEIGTRGGNVKPSTGYAFKNMCLHAKVICKESEIQNTRVKPKSRFVFYDQLLLIILTLWPHKGKMIFERLFRSQSARFVLGFLDEKTNLREELKMFSQLPIIPFLGATVIWSFWKLSDKWILFLIIGYSLFFPSSFSDTEVFLTYYEFWILVVGLFIVGIPHGALDHLAIGMKGEKTISVAFILLYLAIMFGVFAVWYVSPLVWLAFFLIYSSWHFGQTDMENWGVKNAPVGFLWGAFLLSFMLLSHLEEFNYVLSILEIPPISLSSEINTYVPFSLLVPAIFAIKSRQWNWLFMLVYLLVAQQITLILAFGLYFVFHHSVLGWKNLKEALVVSHSRMFLMALPFNLGAFLFFALFFMKMTNSIEFNIVFFLVFLSCISLPHIVCMSRFYTSSKVK